jgi:arylsulfatase
MTLHSKRKRAWMVLIAMITGGALFSFHGSMQALASISFTGIQAQDWNSWNNNNPSNYQANETTIPRRTSVNNTASSEESTTDGTTKQPMNIVLFYADDWTMKTLGLLNPHVHTPNLDKMAKQGVFFRQNCVTTSICWQSRASLMTGVTSSVHQALRVRDRTMYNGTVSWLDTLYPLLRRNNYHVGYLGKYHNAHDNNAFQSAFDWFKSYFGRHYIGNKIHVTEQNAQDALWYLQTHRPRNQSFCLTIAFFATHAQDGHPFETQYEPQPHSELWYNNNKSIPLPITATKQHWKNMPWFFNERNEGRIRWKLRYNTYERYQYTIKRLYRMASEVDEVVGRVIQELVAQNVYNNTLLIFTTDNGLFHGEHGLADKWYPHQESIQVPLIIQDPRMLPQVRGTVNQELTLSVDLAPTILAAAGIQAPSFMQGRDISQLYLKNATEATKSWRKDFFYEWNQGSPYNATGHGAKDWIPAVFALVGRKYKYFYWPQTGYEQFFNISHDPMEESDVFNRSVQTDPALMAKVKKRYEFMKLASQQGLPV